MDKNVFPYSFVYALIIFIGFFDAYSYYFCFGIEISNFMTTGEILISFFPKGLYILPLFGILIFSDIFRNNSNSKAILSNPKNLIDIVEELRTFIYKKNTFISLIIKILNFLFTIGIYIFFYLGFLFYPILIGWYLFYTEVSYQLFIFNGSLIYLFIFFTIFISINFLNKKKLIAYVIIYGVLISSLTHIGVINREKATLIISGQPTHHVTYCTNSKQISTNSTHLFIGQTRSYLFFRNTIDNSNSIVKIEEVRDLKVKKIVD